MPPTKISEIDSIRKDVHQVSEKVSDMASTLAEIKSALVGDEFNKNGIISELESINIRLKHFDERISKLEDINKRYQWLLTGAGAVIMGLAGFIMYLLKLVSLL